MPRLLSPKPRLRHDRRLAHLSPKPNPKFTYPLHSVDGFSSLSSFSSNFPYYSFPRESVWVFADYLRPQFSVSQPNARPSRARGYLCAKPRALKSLIHLSAPPSPLLSFLQLPQISPCPLSLAQTKSPNAKAPSSLWHRFSPT